MSLLHIPYMRSRNKPSVVPLSRLKGIYRRAQHGMLRIGHQYSEGLLWDSDKGGYEHITTRLIVRILIGTDGYYLDNESIDSGAISRAKFWRLLVRFARKGFRQIAAHNHNSYAA